ncbi:MAG: alkaline ceramidase [Chitinophagia bacterium]
MSKIFLLISLLCCFSATSHAQQLKAGASQELINPEKDSLYFAGGKPNRPFVDVHDNLYAKAVVVEDAKTAIAIVSFDCIGLMYPELQRIRAKVKTMVPNFPVDHIVSSSTHTHAGPDVVGIWGKNFQQSGVVDKHMDLIVERAATAVVAAWKNRIPVKVKFATGSFGEDWVKNISEPDLLDRTVSIVKMTDDQNRNVAMVVNFACHPTILDDFATAASSDYVGGYYRYADSAHGGVNIFLQGAIGGWVQPEDVPSSYENAMRYGGSLGAYVFDQLKGSKTLQQSALQYKSAQVKFPVQNNTFKALSGMGTIKRKFADSVQSEIAFFNIGNISFVTHPGETSPALGLISRKLADRKGPVFVMGLAMDALGYILKPIYFNKGNTIPHSEYLTGMSIGPDTMPIIEKVLTDLTRDK